MDELELRVTSTIKGLNDQIMVARSEIAKGSSLPTVCDCLLRRCISATNRISGCACRQLASSTADGCQTGGRATSHACLVRTCTSNSPEWGYTQRIFSDIDCVALSFDQGGACTCTCRQSVRVRSSTWLCNSQKKISTSVAAGQF